MNIEETRDEIISILMDSLMLDSPLDDDDVNEMIDNVLIRESKSKNDEIKSREKDIIRLKEDFGNRNELIATQGNRIKQLEEQHPFKQISKSLNRKP